MLYRKIRKTIESTILRKDGKVLLLLGGRQTGKSHEIKDFASKHYKHFIEINIEIDAAENRFFEKIKTIEDFHVGLKLFVGKELGTKDDTLIFFDNIHFYPQLIELVAKLGKEGKYNYVASSRAVLKLKNANLTDFFNVLTINPLDFEEFLLANGSSEEGIENVRQMFKSKAAMPEVSHMYMMHMFRQYMLVGGLPEAVRVFAETGEIEKVREVQQNCVRLVEKGVYAFDNYFSGKTKLESLFRIIPEELLQKKKRITIKNIEGSTGKRFTDYKKEFDFLEDSYITTSSVAVRNPNYPLDSGQNSNLRKLYPSDVGLFANIILGQDYKPFLDGELSMNSAALYEAAASQLLNAAGYKLCYFDEREKGEVDFLIEDHKTEKLIPLEIKAGKNYTVFSAFGHLASEYADTCEKGIVFTLNREITEKETYIQMPIYYLMFL